MIGERLQLGGKVYEVLAETPITTAGKSAEGKPLELKYTAVAVRAVKEGD